jgi:hypothetical protein
MFSKSIYSFQNLIFNIIIIFSYTCGALIVLGVYPNAATYLANVDYYVRIYVSLFLLLRFNPFRHITFTDLDRKVAFTAGIFIFTTTIVNQILLSYATELRSYIRDAIADYRSDM